ncbi:hypothetical protein A3F07_04895 [candidate division WWE3 bacterium RIFCSPHIGHO2_12_FULL_38_15]|uniref:Uncharacterized protein n=1 Tax=candidate division WWE3 bacterium RIFCSPHIGHO2_02_FULL_38_14 TaxID=1802620 RepID=A0A1F4VA53_UNCKA|nr:MAG: hypothetical protein A3F07_04895 [candidate division WWE3 bacterium RIFCSPHIGHO2_12_FULL_38_15]OGC53770.1 MAG: hypothetical protein A3D91_01350 [candidate division WWE3 bacterium RIFCSPHIGHO2_02_FULL_38_14]OGC54521.1 MAG: hypothetical protein A3B64_04975 [candidate division WWE3 bacterium RIFCSPLOWO2_01_FULL_37_24]
MSVGFTSAFYLGQQYAPLNQSLSLGAEYGNSMYYNPLALGLTSPELPQVAGTSTIKAVQTLQILSSNEVGFALFVFSLSALAALVYFWWQKKGVAKNELP